MGIYLEASEVPQLLGREGRRPRHVRRPLHQLMDACSSFAVNEFTK